MNNLINKVLIFLDRKNIIKLSDENFLKRLYKILVNKELDLIKPKTFNEKLQWLKLHDRKEIYTKMVDKYEAKKYVKEKIGEKYVIPTLKICNKFDDIDFDKLPDKFVMKCTHDSGGVIICKDKSKLCVSKVKAKIEKSLNNNFYKMGREWPYKNVKPRIIIEKYIGEDLVDYRFYCFNGKVKYIYMYLNKSEGFIKPEPEKCNIYDVNWNLQNFHQNSLPTKEVYSAPKQLKEMLENSEILAENTNFLRVDWYIFEDKILFGEMTFFPGGGFSKFHPEEKDLELGKELKINIKGV